ncbi:MAG TPA: hypothetical protein ENF49_01590 [Candidatus Altiarchaeales archaeon]|nr:hypothetical protein [Candidatus Altiarchaeales archaeon]HEX54802.1 hypothetical protein [Candidatus Altiarchaeales archaeon]
MIRMNKKTTLVILAIVLLVLSDTALAVWVIDWVMEKISWGFKWMLENIVRFVIAEPINYLLGLKNDAWKEGWGLLGILVNALKWNPDLSIIRPIVSEIIEVLLPLYVIAMLITGFTWLFLSLSPEGRAKAKAMLLQLLISMVLVSASLPIYQFLLDLSELLVNFVISLVGGIEMTGWASLFTAASIFLVAFFFPLAIVILLLLVVFLLVCRYILLLVMGILFPLAIFLYFFQLTRGVGTKLIRFTLVLIFTPVAQAIFLIFSLVACSNESGVVGIALMFGGIVLMLFAPLILAGFMKWIGGLLFAYGFYKLPEYGHKYGAWGERACATMVFTGALMAGEGAGAVPLAGTIFFLAGLEHAGEHFAEGLSEIPSGHHMETEVKIREFQLRRRRFRNPKRIPKTPEDFERIARQLRNSGEYEKAAEYYEKAANRYISDMKLEPSKSREYERAAAKNYFEAGRMYEKANMIDKAIREYEMAVKFDKNNVKYQTKLADLYFKKG